MAFTVAQGLQSPGELAGRLLEQAPRIGLGLLVVLIGIRAALLVADLAGPPAAAGFSGPLPSQAATRKVVDIPSILRANLFGQSTASTDPNAAPVTAMNLKLAGVFADTDEKRGFAMLGPGTDVKVYKVGDAVPGGARLHAVYVDYVLLDRGGQLEKLLLPPRTGINPGAPPPPAPVLAASPAMSVERVQQAMRDNPGILGQVIQRQAVFSDGKLRGVRVNPGPNAQAFAKLGLRPNDLVTAINGTPLDDQARSNDVFNSLSNSAEARVTVVRSGREQDLTLNLADVANEAEKLADAPPPDPPPTDAPPANGTAASPAPGDSAR